MLAPTEMKKRPEEQAFERLDVRLELHAIFTLGQDHAGDESPECGR